MGDHSNIEWTDATWNPTTGCSKVSPGCSACYAIRTAARLAHLPAYEGVVADGDWTGRVNLVEERLDQPLRWTRPRMVFVDSMSDLFHPEVPVPFIERCFDVMGRANQHTFQVLTKRPQRMADVLSDLHDCDHGGSPWPCAWCAPLANVWLGTSIESDRYVWRADHLRRAPAAVRFLSLEPLLGPVPSLDLTGIDWVIVGGESGPKARPMHPDWVRQVRDRCLDAGVPFFFKQWGEWLPLDERAELVLPPADRKWAYAAPDADTHAGKGAMVRVGKKAAGRVLDGGTWEEMPARAGAVVDG